MKEFAVLGKTVARQDALDKVLGKTKYSGDIVLPGMLYVKALRSETPHARIVRLDTSAAKALPGVHAVLDAKDVPCSNAHGIVVKDEPVLAQGKVRKIGEPLAVVAAENEVIAEAALALIEVDLEELPAVFDAEAAMLPDAPAIHEKGNVMALRKIRKGDVAGAFSRAAIIVENTYRTQMQEHAYIEPEAGVAYCEQDTVVLMVSTQNPHFDRKEVARNLGWPVNKVRVIQAPTGGGFGGKLDISVQIILALLAAKTKRPVRFVYTREESLIATTKRHPCTLRYKTAADEAGRLLAVEATIIGDTGAYASYGPATLTRSAVHATGPYEVPHVKIDAYTVYTNNPTAGAMRGFGVPQVAFAHEQQMDLVALQAGISPFEVRRINALQNGSATTTGQILQGSVGLLETLAQSREKGEAFLAKRLWGQE